MLVNPYRIASGPASPLVLMHCEGPNGGTVYRDEGGHTFTIGPSGTVTNNTAEKKFGASSLLFAGSGYLNANAANLNLNGSDYTFECWFRANSYGSGFGSALFSTWGTTLDGRIVLYLRSTGVLELYEQDGGGSNTLLLTGTTNVTTGVWHHVAAVRDGNDVDLWYEGASEASGSMAPKVSYTNDFRLGVFDIGGGTFFGDFDGRMDEIRLLKYPAYTGAFTPRNAPFPPP